jgi:hypothetical protein
VLVIDPEGDFTVLGRLPGVQWTQIGPPGSWGRTLGYFYRDPSACVVADLSTLPYATKVKMIERGLELVRETRRRLGLPHWIVLDEAHYSLHREGVAEHVLDMAEKGFCLSTYRGSWLRESVLQAIDSFILSRTTLPEELAFLHSLLDSGSGEKVASILPWLPRGEFVLIQPDESGNRTALTFVAPPRETQHVRHLRKYADTPVPQEKRFFFRGLDGQLVGTAGSLNEFREVVAVADARVLAYHAARGDFSRWFLGVFADREAGGQLRKIETRWSRGEISDLREAIERLIATWYGI